MDKDFMEQKTLQSELQFAKNLREEESQKLAQMSDEERINFLIKQDKLILEQAKKMGLKTIKSKKGGAL